MIKFSPTNIKGWARMGQRGAFFGIAMPEIADSFDNLKLLTADLALLSGMDRFEKKHPEKFINVGISEQNMIGIAAGLAMSGDLVYATTYSSFIAVRSLEHIRQHLSHMKCNVKIVGSAAGVIAAKSGVSHWATEDIAFMRVLPNMQVLSPADSVEAIKMAQYAAFYDGPIYIRLSGGLNCPIVYTEDFSFVPGKLMKIRDGKDVAIIATGLMVSESIEAARILEDKGLNCSVFNMNTIKPLDTVGLREIFNEYSLIATVEEHNVLGGMGSAVAEYKAGFERAPRQIFIGFQDRFTDAGTQTYVWDQAGITAEHIANKLISESKH